MSDETAMKMSAIREKLGLSYSYFSAVKRAMGLKGVHVGRMEQFNAFFADNPNFKYAEIYHAGGCNCTDCTTRRAAKAAKKAAKLSAVN